MQWALCHGFSNTYRSNGSHLAITLRVCSCCRETTWRGNPFSSSEGEGEEKEADVTDQRCEKGHTKPGFGACLHPSLWSQHTTREPASQGGFAHTLQRQKDTNTPTNALCHYMLSFISAAIWGYRSLGYGYIQSSRIFWKPSSDSDHVHHFPGRNLFAPPQTRIDPICVSCLSWMLLINVTGARPSENLRYPSWHLHHLHDDLRGPLPCRHSLSQQHPCSWCGAVHPRPPLHPSFRGEQIRHYLTLPAPGLWSLSGPSKAPPTFSSE